MLSESKRRWTELKRYSGGRGGGSLSGKLISAPGKSFYKMIDNHEVRYAIGCRRPLYWPHSGRRCAAFVQSLPSPRKGKTKIKRWFHCEIRTQSFGVESKLTRKGKGEGGMEGGKRETQIVIPRKFACLPVGPVRAAV